MKCAIAYAAAFAVLATIFSASAGLVLQPTSGTGTQSAWNPSDKGSNMTISTTTVTNDTASATSNVGSEQLVRGTRGYATGTANKKVFTVTFSVDTLTSGDFAGVSDLGSGNDGTYPGQNSLHSFGLQDQGVADAIDQTMQTPTCSGITTGAGNVVWIAIDFNTGKLNCSIDCHTWASAGNPDGGTGPYTLSSATYYPAGGLNTGFNDLQRIIINTNPTLSGCTNITTFSQWG